jgi:methylase of polypeptide subunit release factors
MTCSHHGAKLSANNEYPTPHDFARQIASICAAKGWLTPGMRVLEPCAGEGNLAVWLRCCCDNIHIDAVEQSDKYRRSLERRVDGAWIADYIQWKAPAAYDLIITNPPFADAERITRKALSELKPGGHLVLLQRLGFLAGIARNASFWAGVTYSELLVCTARPKFLNNTSDSADYGWFVFTDHALNQGTTSNGARPCLITHLPKPELLPERTRRPR